MYRGNRGWIPSSRDRNAGRRAERRGDGQSAGTRAGLDDRETLAQFVRNLGEGIYITSRDGTILDANPAFLRMLGLSSKAELADLSARDVLVDPARRVEELRVLTRDGSVREFELQLRRPDGTVLTLLDTAYQSVDPATGEVLYHGILVDISARKELERQLREAAIRSPGASTAAT